MLRVTDRLPEGLLELEAVDIGRLLPGPTLIHLPGRRRPALFVSVLLHGNEDTGWQAVRNLFSMRRTGQLPRALSLFIGNVAAAGEGKRFLPGQPDYNRIWDDGNRYPEARMANRVVDEMQSRGVFACVDIHNNTGVNPHYTCIRSLENTFLNLATLFGRTVVFFRKPEGVQIQAFSHLCPTVAIECGKRGYSRGADHAKEYIEACLNLAEIPDHPVPEHDLELFHTVAVVKVLESASLALTGKDGDVTLRQDIDHLNFRELPAGTCLGTIRGNLREALSVRDELGKDVTVDYFSIRRGRLVTKKPLMPSMFTGSIEAIRQDCLGYFLERMG